MLNQRSGTMGKYIDSHLVNETQRTAASRRKPGSVHHAHIDVRRRFDDAFLDTASRFHTHWDHQTFGYLVVGESRRIIASYVEQLVDRIIRPGTRAPAGVGLVFVKTFTRFLAEASCAEQGSNYA